MPLPDAVLQLLEGSVDACVILDSERRIQFYNRAYESIAALRGRKLHMAVEEGLHCHEVLPLSICANDCVGCKALDKRRTIRVDEIVTLKRPEQLTFIVTASIIGGDYIIETYRDVTPDVRIQQRLKEMLRREREMNATLEEKVRERSEQLEYAHAQLVLQEKMSTLGRLVAGIAHELNNPINFVYGNIDFLERYVEDLLGLVKLVDEDPRMPEEMRSIIDAFKEEIEYDYLIEDCGKLIDSIRTGAERTAMIVRDLKSFSRAGSSQFQEFDVKTGIETTLNLIAPLVKNRIEIRREFDPDVPLIMCNGGHINQVFMNILTNAAQAIADEGWIRIAIKSLDGGKSVAIIVEDSGQGISEDHRAKITDPFFTTKEVGGGSGLGLWITLSIVRKHGGTLDCASAPGKGATFTVVLPKTPPEDISAEPGDFGHVDKEGLE